MNKAIGAARKLVIIAWLAVISISYLNLFPFRQIIPGLPSLSGLSLPAGYVFLPLLGLAVFLFSAFGLGSIFWNRAGLPKTDLAVFSSGTGIGIFSLYLLGLNLVSFMNVYSVLLPVFAGCVFAAAALRRGVFGGVKPPAALLAASVIPLLSTLIAALAPPTLFDSLVYHLALPAKYIAAGTMRGISGNIFFSFPQNIEMLFQAALLFKSDILANLIHWSFFPLTALAVFATARRFWGGRTAVASAAVWLFSPAVMLLATGTYIDLGLAFFCFISLYCLLLWRETGESRYAVFAGVFAGIAAGAKYTALIPAAITAVLFAVYGKKPKPALLFSAAAFAVFSPWLLKNIIFLKNPIAPWGAGFFSGSLVSKEAALGYFAHISGHGIPVKGIADLLLIPWNLTAYGFRYGGGFDIAGPLFLLFLPALFLYLKIDKIDRVFIIFSTLFLLSWLFTGKVLRFMMPLLPVLSILTARGMTRVFSERTKLVAMLVLSGALVHNILLFHWIMAEVDPYSPVLKKESAAAYLGRKLNYYPALADCVNKLPPGSRTLFLGETRGYYAAGNCVVPTIFDANPAVGWANASLNAKAVHASAREAGITHILVNNYEYSRLGFDNLYTETGRRTNIAFKKDFLISIYKDAYCEVFRLK